MYPPLSRVLLQRQLLLFGRIAHMANESVMADSIFEHNNVTIKSHVHRKRGRPRNTWSNEVTKVANKVAHDTDLHEATQNQMSWHKSVKSFCAAHTC